MLLAIDYDLTYPADTTFWDAVIDHAVARGHMVVFTSLRTNDVDEPIAPPHRAALALICSEGKAKHHAVYKAGYCPSVWIDSSPSSIIDDNAMLPAPAELARPQLLALDYDETYTRDPAFWSLVIRLAKQAGHTVLCATMRYPSEAVTVRKQLAKKVSQIITTGRKAKLPALENLGLSPNVWIDDHPSFILNDAYDPAAEIHKAQSAAWRP